LTSSLGRRDPGRTAGPEKKGRLEEGGKKKRPNYITGGEGAVHLGKKKLKVRLFDMHRRERKTSVWPPPIRKKGKAIASGPGTQVT